MQKISIITLIITNTESDSIFISGLVCVPLHQCGNVYGTNGQHVRKFGFISPLETGCLANAGIQINFLKVFLQGYDTKDKTQFDVYPQ